MITITSDFECGNGKSIQRISESRFRLEVDADKQDGYCVYFCFDVNNDGPETEVTVELWEDPRFDAPTAFPVFFPTTIWIKPVGFHRYRPLLREPVQRGNHIVMGLDLEADQRLRAAMTYVAPYSEVSQEIRTMAGERSHLCSLLELGSSVEGRDILGLRVGTPGKPKVLCIAGQHPHEHAGVWGVLGIADLLLVSCPSAISGC